MTAHLRNSYAGAVENGGSTLVRFVKNSSYIFVVTAIIASVSYTVLARLSPRYWAEATVRIDAGSPRSTAVDATKTGAGGLGQELMAAQLQLLRSRDLARTVAQSLDLEGRPGVLAALGGDSVVAHVLGVIGLRPDPGRSSREERILEAFAANLSVSVIDGASVIAVAFTAGDPRLAADAANAVAGEYVALQRAVLRDAGDAATRRLEGEIGGLRNRVEAIESKVRVYRAGIERLLAGSAGPLAGDPARQQRARAQLEDDLRQLHDEAARQRAVLASYEHHYRDVLTRRQSGVLPVDARIRSRAAPPAESYFPKQGLLTAIIGAFALLAMLAVVVVRELGRRRQPAWVDRVPLPEVVSAAPIRVAAARWNDDRGVRRMMPAAPTFADTGRDDRIGDSLAMIAHKLVFDKTKRVMVVTAGEDVGKCRPLAAVTLARALARADRRPVLIDLRDDGADSLSMGEAADLPGFSDLFAGDASFGQVIFRDRKSRVHFIPAGHRQLSEMDFADQRVGLLVSSLDLTYDHVVFDVAGDSVEAIGSQCDAAVVATIFHRDDPRTTAVVRRVRSNSQAKVVVVRVDPREMPEAGFAATLGDAAA